MTADRPTLATLFRGRPRDDVARFVASLYDARGARTRLDGGAVVVDGDRYLVVPAGPIARLRDRLTGPPSHRVDAVVAVDADRAEALAARYDAPAVTPADLDDIARYGVDRGTADTIVRETFGVGLDALRPMGWRSEPDDTADSPATTLPTRDGSSRTRRAHPPAPADVPRSTALAAALVVGVVAVLVLAPASVGLDAGPFAGLVGSEPPTDEQPASTADDRGTGVADEATTSRPDASADDALSLAPGLTTDGITDVDALADAHAASIENRSYRWELTYVEEVNGTERGRLVESVVVESPTVYHSTVRVEGAPNSRGPIAPSSSYADGDRRYQWTADGIESEPVAENGVLGRPERRASRYYGVLLDGQVTSHVRTIFDQPRLYVVDIQGAPAFSVRNYTATAHVAPDGFVRYFSGSYCLVSFRANTPDTCVSLTMQYRLTPDVTVEPPAWYRPDAAATPTPKPTPSTTVTSNASTAAPTETPNASTPT